MARPEFTRSAVLRGGSIVAAGTISSSALAAALTTILGIELGDKGFGIYSFVIATAGLLAAIARFGLGPIVIREIARSRKNKTHLESRTPILNALAITTFASVILIALTISPIGILALRAASDLDTTMVGALALLFASQALYTVNVESLRGLHRLGSASFLGLPIQRFVALILVLWVVYATAKDLNVALALWLTGIAAASSVMVSGFSLWIRSRKLPGTYPTFADGLYMAKSGVPILLTNVLGITSNRMPIWVLAALGALEETGTYALAAAFVALIRLAHKTMIGTLAPFVATSYFAEDRKNLQHRIRTVAAATSLLALGASVALIIAGVTAVPRLFGSDFENVVPVASILLIGTLAMTLAGPSGMVLTVTGNERWMTRATTFSLVAGAISIVPAAIIAGAIGAAFVMALTTVLRVSLQVRYTVRQTNIFTAADFHSLIQMLRGSKP